MLVPQVYPYVLAAAIILSSINSGADGLGAAVAVTVTVADETYYRELGLPTDATTPEVRGWVGN